MKNILLTVATMAICTTGLAQDSSSTKKQPLGLYTFFVNSMPSNCMFPLVGFLNHTGGNHTSLQAGFINTTGQDLRGMQAGFINTTGGSITGMQAGFLNTGSDSLLGIQAGFINMVFKNAMGGQFGFLNTAGGFLHGMQAGFVNSCKDSAMGMQAGFINHGGNRLTGAQLGFINISQNLQGMQAGFANTGTKVEGAQLGFVNRAKTVKGFQLGFINVADTVEGGVPFGFLSFVKNGGYCSIEAGVSEMFPVNLAFKVGVQKFYTTFITSFNPDHENPFSVGAGFGTIFPLSKILFLNPEAVSQNNIGDFTQQTVSFTPYLGIAPLKKLHLVVGPSVVWNCIYEGNQFYKPFYSLSSHELDKSNRLITGVRVGIRYNFK